MDNTRIRRPKSPALPPPPSPASLVRSKSRSSAAITLPENNSCAANTSQRSNIHRSKSVTKSRTKNKDEENLNPLNCKTKAGFTKPLKSSPATSPSAWALSPGRSLGSPFVLSPLTAVEPAVVDGRRGKLGGQRGGAVSGVLRFFRPKKAAAMTAEAEELHRFRILQNRLLQWKYVNVRAEISMANVKTLVQDKIFSVWLHNLRMRNRILEKRIEVEKLRKEIKLYRIIFPQVSLLKQWAKLDKRNQESIGSLASVLSTLSLRLPLLHGAKIDIKAFEQALSMAMEVITKLEAMITKSTFQQLEKKLYMLTERLSIFKEQEDSLERLEEAVCSVTTLVAAENSIRIQLIQATNSSKKDPTS
ncbi:QWRF motif-containing protein 7 [Benincasa hispida]|uniref:QWRF motif-containing protein 7 n=1 Tax=Benincasa hispida TaxID=102211 RepID=UPI0018FF83DD|nr:QWRF motif-containing protein 7 [Benincasa hispida]